MILTRAAHSRSQELIPEFFLPQGDFLLNQQGLPLGVRQSGAAVDDVELPPWASELHGATAGGRHAPPPPSSSSSATAPSPFLDVATFLAVHRAALESPPVSRDLHRWIDLVFGNKQRGPLAGEIRRVFFTTSSLCCRLKRSSLPGLH
jgi:factor associated with neutral sphingomyelinase activation